METVIRLLKALSSMVVCPFMSVYFLLDAYAEIGCICFDENRWPWQRAVLQEYEREWPADKECEQKNSENGADDA